MQIYSHCLWTQHRAQCLLPLFLIAVVVPAPVVYAASSESSGYATWPMWALVLFCTCTVLLSAMYCGLTIGLLGMETIYLEIIADAGPEPDCRYATKILPVRRLGHQLLCTLLVGNMLTLVLTSQLMAAIVQGSEIVNFISSTVIILIFGEVIPMSICNNQKYVLSIGSKSLPALQISLFLLYPIAKPLGLLLDVIVGHDAGQIYDRNELKKLIRLHCEKFSDKSGIDMDQVHMMLSALELNETTVDAAMTPMENVLMLDGDLSLNAELEKRLWELGKSRLPVFSGDRGNIIGILYVKDLVNNSFLGRDTTLSVRQFLLEHPRDIFIVPAGFRLQTALTVFKHQHTSLMFVEQHVPLVTAAPPPPPSSSQLEENLTMFSPSGRAAAAPRLSVNVPLGEEPQRARTSEKNRDPDIGAEGHMAAPSILSAAALLSDGLGERQLIGVVTLEDIIEKVIASEIYDEDEYWRSDMEGDEVLNLNDDRTEICDSAVEKMPQRLPRINFYSYGVPPRGQDSTLSDAQLWVLAAFLTRAYISFATWTIPQVKYLLSKIGDVVIYVDNQQEADNESALRLKRRKSSVVLATDSSRVLYKAGQPTTTFTLVLSGRIDMVIGTSGIRNTMSAFSDLAADVLLSPHPFVPDYTAVVRSTSRILRITQEDMKTAEQELKQLRSEHRQQRFVGVNSPNERSGLFDPNLLRRKGKKMASEDVRIVYE